MKGKTGFGAFPRTPYIINVLPLLTYKSGFLVLFATQKWTKLQKKFFYVYVLYISRTYTLFRTFFWTRNRKISYTFYLYVLCTYIRIRYYIRFTYTLLYEKTYTLRFWFCFEFSRGSLQWRPLTLASFGRKSFLRPKFLWS